MLGLLQNDNYNYTGEPSTFPEGQKLQQETACKPTKRLFKAAWTLCKGGIFQLGLSFPAHRTMGDTNAKQVRGAAAWFPQSEGINHPTQHIGKDKGAKQKV